MFYNQVGGVVVKEVIVELILEEKEISKGVYVYYFQGKKIGVVKVSEWGAVTCYDRHGIFIGGASDKKAGIFSILEWALEDAIR